VESLLLSLSTQGYYVGSKNTVFWDVFTAVSMADVFWDFVPCTVFFDTTKHPSMERLINRDSTATQL
jgi:hypothetical protein